MLNFLKSNRSSAIVLITLIVFQLFLVFKQQLFGDESFYWLESRFTDWSYTELPGWTAWMIRLGTSLFGNNYFAVRALSFIASVSIFFSIRLILGRLSQQGRLFENILLITALPLYVLIATMALPDIWMIATVMWMTYFLIAAVQSNHSSYWFLSGLFLAISVNIHVRMWIWIFFAGISFLVCFKQELGKYKKIFLITLPIALTGFIPVMYFNLHHGFALFEFQFVNRNPWKFQVSNLAFLIFQLIVVSPLVFGLWLGHASKILRFAGLARVVKWILMTSLLHWLFYVITAIFADGLRTNVHWLLISYIPVLAISTVLCNQSILRKAAVFSGLFFSMSLLLTLILVKSASSNWQSRILDNSIGWKQLAQEVRQLQTQYQTKYLVADYFMTAAEMAFELGMQDSLETMKVLPHPKNIKHGRQKQLEIMSMLLADKHPYSRHALLVVEDSSVKLEDKGSYYTKLCDRFKQMNLVNTVNISQSTKQFHVFEINNDQQSCTLPPFFYIQHKLSDGMIEISGWVVLHETGIRKVSIIGNAVEREIPINNFGIANNGIQTLFPQIQDPGLPNSGFSITLDKDEFEANSFQIKAVANDGKSYLSGTYFLN